MKKNGFPHQRDAREACDAILACACCDRGSEGQVSGVLRLPPLDKYPWGVYSGLRQNKGVTRMSENCCGEKTKERSPEEYKSLVNRLNRIEGQIRGIRGMLDKNAYCPDILAQVAAANAALNAFSKELLSNHIRSCVVNDVRAGNDEVIDELLVTLQKLMK